MQESSAPSVPGPHSGPAFEKMRRETTIGFLMLKLCQVPPSDIAQLLAVGKEKNSNDPLDGVYQFMIQRLKEIRQPNGAPTSNNERAIFDLGWLFKVATSYDALMEVLTFVPLESFIGEDVESIIGNTLLHIIVTYKHYDLLLPIINRLQELDPARPRTVILQAIFTFKNHSQQTVFSLIDFKHLSSLEDHQALTKELRSLPIPASPKIINNQQETFSCKFYQEGSRRFSALHKAAMGQNIGALTRYFQEGMDPNVSARVAVEGFKPSVNQNTPLNLWVETGLTTPNERVLTTLLQYGANIESKGCGGQTALQLAIRTRGHSSQFYVPLLLKHGAHLSIEDLPPLLDLERLTNTKMVLPLNQLDLVANPRYHPPIDTYQNHIRAIIEKRKTPGFENSEINLAEILLEHRLYGQPGTAREIDVYPSPFWATGKEQPRRPVDENKRTTTPSFSSTEQSTFG